FQAEDGIRDFHVTGVQTCALPIYPFSLVTLLIAVLLPLLLGTWQPAQAAFFVLTVDRTDDEAGATTCLVETPDDCSLRGALSVRSEERRGGEGGSGGWWR